jgi:hypothetical protein
VRARHTSPHEMKPVQPVVLGFNKPAFISGKVNLSHDEIDFTLIVLDNLEIL